MTSASSIASPAGVPPQRPLARAVGAIVRGWSPAQMFAANDPGVWFEPGDFARYIGAKGPELCVAGNFDDAAAWGMAGLPDWQIVAGKLQKTGTSAGGGPVAVDLAGVVAGRTYEVTFTIDSVAGGGFAVQFNDAVNGSIATTTMNAPGTYRFALVAVSSLARFRVTANVAGVTGVVDSVSVRELTAIDTASLYQDAAGTVPVTAVEQPVGLMLDKRFGLVRGAELVANGAFDSASGWNLTASFTISGGKLNVNGGVAFAAADYPLAGMAGKTVEVVLKATRTSGAGNLVVQAANTTQTTVFVLTAASGGTYRGIATMPAGAGPRLAFVNDSTGAWVGTIDDVSVRELPGNHASQATAAARPVLSARVNQLNTSNPLAGGWTFTNATVTADVDGYVRLIEAVDVGQSHQMARSSGLTATVGAVYATQIKIKKSPHARRARLQLSPAAAWGGTAPFTTFDPATGAITATQLVSSATAQQIAPDEWILTMVCNPVTVAAGTITPLLNVANMTGTGAVAYDGDGVSYILAKDAQIEPGSVASRFQRINSTTDYDSVGFPHYLKFDGVDDWMVAQVDLSAVDKCTAIVGMTKRSDAAVAVIFEHAITTGAAPAVAMFAPIVAAQASTSFRSGASTLATTTPMGVPAPYTAVLVGSADVAADRCQLRRNGVDNANNGGDQGAGNYSSAPLRIGGRGSGTNNFNGDLHLLILRGAASDAATIAACDRYAAPRTGVTL